jgi:hypothetical protein
LDAFFLGSFGSTALGGRMGEGLCGGLGSVDDRITRGGWCWWWAGELVGVPVVGGEFISLVTDRDRVAAMGADDPARLVLWRRRILGFLLGLWGGHEGMAKL